MHFKREERGKYSRTSLLRQMMLLLFGRDRTHEPPFVYSTVPLMNFGIRRSKNGSELNPNGRIEFPYRIEKSHDRVWVP